MFCFMQLALGEPICAFEKLLPLLLSLHLSLTSLKSRFSCVKWWISGQSKVVKLEIISLSEQSPLGHKNIVFVCKKMHFLAPEIFNFSVFPPLSKIF